MKLFTIVVGDIEDHPYWRKGAFAALGDNDWGPSPTFRMVDVPIMFLSAREAQETIKRFNHFGVEMRVATFEGPI